MKIGLGLPTFDEWGTREAIVRAAQLAEADGWDSVWVTDHILMAAHQQHPYGHIFEAVSTLSFVGGMTTRVKLGTSIIVLPQRNPIIVAKEFATLDALSNGRVILGVAAGWNEDEFRFLGADPTGRGRRLEEGIAVIRELWTQPHPTFEGHYFKFRDTLFSPKPTQKNGIPIWLGGNSEIAIKRAARLGDGWHVTGATPERFREGIDLIRPRLNGRPFTFSLRVEVDASGQLPSEFAGPDGSRRRRLPADIDAASKAIEAYGQIGVEHVIIVPVGASSEKMFEHLKMMGRELLPRFR